MTPKPAPPAVNNPPPDRNRFQRHAKLILFGFTAVMMLVIVFASEFALSRLNPSADGTKRHIRLREHSPNRVDTYPVAEGEEEAVTVEIDEQGFIAPSAVHEEPDFKIVFLGGSTTECRVLHAEDRFPYLVGQLLQESTGQKVNCYNAGVSGNNSMHSNNILINKVAPLEPDFVVLMHNVNDLGVLLHEGTYWNRAQTKSLVVETSPPTAISSTKQLVRTLIPHLYDRARQLTLQGTPEAQDEWAHRRGESITIEHQPLVQKFESSLQLFVAAARILSMEPVLMTQGNRYRTMVEDDPNHQLNALFKAGLTFEDYKAIYDLFNQTIRDVAMEHDILLIDLDEEVPSSKENFSDGIHYTTAGSRIAAEAIAAPFAAHIELLRDSQR